MNRFFTICIAFAGAILANAQTVPDTQFPDNGLEEAVFTEEPNPSGNMISDAESYNFNNGTTGNWEFLNWNNGGGKAEANAVSPGYRGSAYCLEIYNPEDQGSSYLTQLRYELTNPIEQGKFYRLSFVAKADKEGAEFQFVAGQQQWSGNKEWYGENLSLTTDWQEYSMDMYLDDTYPEEGMNLLSVYCGTMVGKVYLDRISLFEEDETEPNPSGNIISDAESYNFNNGTAGNWAFSNWNDGSGKAEVNAVSPGYRGSAYCLEIYNPEDQGSSYLTQPRYNLTTRLEKGKLYRLSFVAKAENEGAEIQFMAGQQIWSGNKEWYGENLLLTTYWQEYSMDMYLDDTYSEEGLDLLSVFCGTMVGKVYLDRISLIDITGPGRLLKTKLTADMMHKWDGPEAGANIEVWNCNPNYFINEAAEPAYIGYGDAALLMENYADLSDYKALVVKYSTGTPRLLFNVVNDEQGVHSSVEVSPNYSKYVTETYGTWIIDLAAITSDYGYAHLNAIKEVYWQKVQIDEAYLLSNTMLPDNNKILTTGENVGTPGRQVIMPIYLHNKDNVCNFQFNMHLPDGISVAEQGLSARSYVINKGESRFDDLDHTVTSSLLDDGSIKVLVYSGSNANIWDENEKGEDIRYSEPILYVTLNVADNVAEGNYIVEFTNIILSSYNNGKTVKSEWNDCMNTVSIVNRYVVHAECDDTKGLTYILGYDYDQEDETARGYETLMVFAEPADGYTFWKWMENGQEVSLSNPYAFEPKYDRSLTAVYVLLGDVYADEVVDVADLTETVGLILTEEQVDDRTRLAADVYKDDYIDVADLTSIVGIILNGGGNAKSFGVSSNAKSLGARTDVMPEVVNMQFDVVMPENISINERLLAETLRSMPISYSHDVNLKAQKDGSMRVLITSFVNSPIENAKEGLDNFMVANDGTLADGTYGIILKNVVMSYSDMTVERFDSMSASIIVDDATSINGMNGRTESKEPVFGIDGRKAENISKGQIYIRKGRSFVNLY